MERSRTTAVTAAALASLGIALVVLATLQYRWIGRLAEADGKRMHASMEFAAVHFTDEIDRELTRTFVAFQAPLPSGSADELAGRYERWAAVTRDPRMIRAIYFLMPGSTDLQRLDIEHRKLVPAAWPADLEPVRARLAAMTVFEPHAIPPISNSLKLIVPCGGVGMMMRHALGMPPEGHGPGMMMAGPMAGMGRASCPAFTIVQLDRDYLSRVFLPDLTYRYFQAGRGSEFEVAVVSAHANDVLFRSPDWPRSGDARADLVMPIFTILHFANGAPPPRPLPANWQLLVRHRNGSLAATVEAMKMKNIAIALAVLAVLGGSAATLLVMLRRAQKLQQQQLEFVAGITHELNTPLAALTSAGQNLADGIVREGQTAQYGAIVLKESRRLSDMVAEVLDYAGMEAGRRPLRSDDVDVHAIVSDAVEQCRWMIDGKSVRIDVDADRSLPHVSGDVAALTRAVQNLVANAIRHGSDGGWVRVSAAAEKTSIAITVEDGGRGVAARDLPHIFEPFFRGAAAAQVRGSGLGLTIVDRIARAHGGSVEVDTHRRQGAAFTLRLPLRTGSAAAPEIASQHA